jgi:nitrous oxidase accessory protein
MVIVLLAFSMSSIHLPGAITREPVQSIGETVHYIDAGSATHEAANSPSTSRALASSRIIYVDGSNAGDPLQDGSSLHPFDTIGKATNAATSGDTIKVAGNCTYNESVSIRESISLTKWKYAQDPIIDGTKSGRNYVLDVETSDVTVSGFVIQGPTRVVPHYGILCLGNTDRINISGNVITENDYGIWVYPGSHKGLVITGNTVDNAQRGMIIYGLENSPVQESFITNNTVRGYWPAVEEALGAGLFLEYGNNNSIAGNEFRNFTDATYLLYTSSSICTNNTIYDCYAGIASYDSMNSTFAGNDIRGCNCGIYCNSSYLDTITGNFLYDDDFAVVFHSVNLATVLENTVMLSGYEWFVQSFGGNGNCFYHNDVFDVQAPPCYEQNSTDRWDNGSKDGGNYWDDYNGTDIDGNGFGDIPYPVATHTFDNYPLDVPYGPIPIFSQGVRYNCTMSGNVPVSNIYFDELSHSVIFDITVSTLTGQCSLTIPRLLLDGKFMVIEGGPPTLVHLYALSLPVSVQEYAIPSILSWNDTHTSISFAYGQSGTHNVAVMAEFEHPVMGWPDLNGDGQVNILDIAIVARHFGQKTNPQR